METILVTGGFGFIGSSIIKELNNREITDIVVVETSDKFMEIADLQISDYYSDTDFGYLSYTYDKVFHLGGYTAHTDSFENCKSNFEFTKMLLDKLKINKTFSYASSASVYGNISNTAINENSPLHPTSPYSFFKALTDQYMFSKCNKSYNIQSLRYFNVYEEKSITKYEQGQCSPIYKFKKQAIENQLIIVFENSENIYRDFVNVNDVVNAQIDLSEHNVSGIYNLGSGNATSFKTIADLIAQKFKAKIEIIEFPSNLFNTYQWYTLADISKIKLELPNYNPISVEQYILNL